MGPVNDRAKLKKILSSCDLFLFPSTFDNDPLAVKEVASSGLGAVLINGSSSAEGTTHMKNVILIDENALSLADALMKGNVELYHQIGETAMNDIYISWPDVAKKAYERYEYVAANYEPKKRSFKLNEQFFRIIASVSTMVHRLNELEENTKKFGNK